MKIRMALMCLATCVASAAQAISYTVTEIGPGEATAINRSGAVTGRLSLEGGDRAFIYREGTVALLGTLGGSWSAGAAINDRCDVVGSSGSTSHPEKTLAFLWNGVDMKNLGGLGGTYSLATGITRDRTVSGWSSTAGTEHATVYGHGVLTDLGSLGGPATSSVGLAINELGRIAGRTDIDATSATRAFVYSDGVMTDLGTLPGGGDSAGHAINRAGEVAGYAVVGIGRSAHRHAVVFSAGAVIDLGHLGGGDSQALAINADGDVVGWSTLNRTPHPVVNHHRAFVYRKGRMHPLTPLLEPATGAGWVIKEARGINDKGQIAGTGERDHDGIDRAVLLTPARPSSSAPGGQGGAVSPALAAVPWPPRVPSPWRR